MSLPLQTIGAVAEAAKIAQGISRGVARGVSDAMGFHAVLSEPGSADDVQAAADLIEKIRDRLAQLGVEVNQDLPIGISTNGQLQIEGEHPRAAEIESVLNSDEQISQLVGRLSASQQASGLTIAAAQGNIRNSAGGYPNW